jgi:hypothetical protein
LPGKFSLIPVNILLQHLLHLSRNADQIVAEDTIYHCISRTITEENLCNDLSKENDHKHVHQPAEFSDRMGTIGLLFAGNFTLKKFSLTPFAANILRIFGDLFPFAAHSEILPITNLSLKIETKEINFHTCFSKSPEKGAILRLKPRSAAHPKTTKSMHAAVEMLGLDCLWVVYPDSRVVPLTKKITAVPLDKVAEVALH